METTPINVFSGDLLDPGAFEPLLRQVSQDFSRVLASAVRTQSPTVESSHFLMMLAEVPRGATMAGLADRGLSSEQWQSGLADSAVRSPEALPLLALSREAFDDSALGMLEEAATLCAELNLPCINELVLLYCGLNHATPPVRDLCQLAGVDLAAWMTELKKQWAPVISVTVFETTSPYAVQLTSFTPGARTVLKLLQREAESLGADLADARHLLLALLEHEAGAMHYGLHVQGIAPRKVQQALMLALRNRQQAGRTGVSLDQAHLQPLLRQILMHAGELAGRAQKTRIDEPTLLEAFLAVESAARRILEQQKVDLGEIRRTAQGFEVDEQEQEQADFSAMADVDTIERLLKQRLVGQDEAITRILPHIQRMRFGFTNPKRPVGVFLFCGQSGSGKTEMAKELVRAVYGSEDSLLFLEMGQFNSPESMNIFVGAAPGYVGYGEGKLTNGLRDKPRAVVLFDEVEKAHARVLDALLRFLDEGKISDPAGPVRDGTQCLVILTSNVGAEELSRLWQEIEHAPNSKAVIRKRLREEFRKHNFRVEFLNRVDELLLFRTLCQADYIEITRRILRKELDRLREQHGIDIVPDDSVPTLIGGYCAGIGEGARAAQRLVQSVVVTPAIDHVVRHACPRPARLKVRAVRGLDENECEPEGFVET